MTYLHGIVAPGDDLIDGRQGIKLNGATTGLHRCLGRVLSVLVAAKAHLERETGVGLVKCECTLFG